MRDDKSFSVCVAFKDWGLDRLDLHLASYAQEVRDLGGEIIVSDYNSSDSHAVASVAQRHGAKYHRVVGVSGWSRSRALNAGLSQACAPVLMTTDADMIFEPGTMRSILDQFRRSSPAVMNLQCRDLGRELGVEKLREEIDRGTLDWRVLDESSLMRPRWGVGGLAVFSAQAFCAVRGLDERMQTYGSEDRDFVTRVQRAGWPHRWITGSEARMYHVWHPSTRSVVESTTEGRAAVDRARSIFADSRDFIRNTEHWDFAPDDAKPLASVVIATRNRASFLRDAVCSALSQTARDIEVLVIDDGSSDNTQEVLATIADKRLRVFRREPGGVAAARNFATAQARADWIVIHDDDDIMLPTRVQDHFAALEAGMVGTYGGWIDFEDGNLAKHKIFPGRDFDDFAVRGAGETLLHPTTMVAKAVLEQLPYDEGYRSGSDFNLFTRVARMGGVMGHTGRIANLRRLHAMQLTAADAEYQQSSWRSSKALGVFNVSLPQLKFELKSHLSMPKPSVCSADDAVQLLKKYAPSGQSARWLVASGIPSVPGEHLDRSRAKDFLTLSDGEGRTIWSRVTLQNPSWYEIWSLGGFQEGSRVALEAPDNLEWDWPFVAAIVGRHFCVSSGSEAAWVSENGIQQSTAKPYWLRANQPVEVDGEVWVSAVQGGTPGHPEGVRYLRESQRAATDVLVSLGDGSGS